MRRGVEAEKAGNFAVARTEYEKALDLAPQRVDAMANLGAVFLRTGQPDQAAARFRQALALRPEMPQLGFFLGLALYEAGRFDEAHQALVAFLKRVPGDARGLHLNGLCLLKLDRLDEGIRLLEESLAKAPDNRAAKTTLATALVSVGELSRAEELVSGSEGPEVQLVRGMVLNAKGRYREAETALLAARQANPRLPSLNNQLGYTLMLLGDYPGAIRAFEAELAISPKDFNAGANLGWILVKDREFDRAEALLAGALKARPSNAGVLYLLGQVWSSKGETARAVEALERVVAQKPSFRAAHVLLARGYAKLGRAADAGRVQAAIRKLTDEEQARNLGSHESYADRPTAPDFTEGKKP